MIHPPRLSFLCYMSGKLNLTPLALVFTLRKVQVLEFKHVLRKANIIDMKSEPTFFKIKS